MKKWHFFLAGLALMAACTEKTDLRSDGEYNEYLVVDATLTDQAGVPQQVMLSRTVPYFSDGQEQAAAAVPVSRHRSVPPSLRRRPPVSERWVTSVAILWIWS